MARVQLIYRSYKKNSLPESELEKILLTAISHNTNHNLTGLLLHDDVCFVQVLEGKKDAVYDLMDRIIQDPRHHKIVILQRKQISRRQFLQWTMQGITLPEFYTNLCMKLFNSTSGCLDSFKKRYSEVNLAHLSLYEIEELFQFVSTTLQIYPDMGIIPIEQLRKPQPDTHLIQQKNVE